MRLGTVQIVCLGHGMTSKRQRQIGLALVLRGKGPGHSRILAYQLSILASSQRGFTQGSKPVPGIRFHRLQPVLVNGD